jgi:hypothetical protein
MKLAAMALGLMLVAGSAAVRHHADHPMLAAAAAVSAASTAPAPEGAKPVPSDFQVAEALQPSWGHGKIPNSAAPDVVGAFRFICTAGQVLADDPIVYPGQPGKSHLHQFYGNEDANASSTFASLRARGASTCNRGPHAANRSAYWMPAMLDGSGQVVKPEFVSIYYKRRPASDPKCRAVGVGEGTCVSIPNGIKFIFGYDMLTGKWPTGNLWFNCQGPGSHGGHYANLAEVAPNCPIGAKLGAVITAPSCWDGKNLDSPNHRDHVAYKVRDGNSGQLSCPRTHPYVMPTFELQAWYLVTNDPTRWSLSSDAMHPDLPKGTTFHADYFEAWDPAVKAMWTANCIDKMLSCSGGDLGNGEQLKGAQLP